MNNAFIADSVIVLILLVGAVVGAKRGLIKSLMGVFVVIGALIGAQMLADMLTEPVADIVAPKIENNIVEQFSEALESEGATERSGVWELLEKYGVNEEVLEPYLNSFASTVFSAVAESEGTVAESFRSAASTGIRAFVRGTVHTVLVLVFYLVLFVVLTLLAKVLDKVFDLPLLDMTNAVGGAMMGILEAGATIFVLLFFATRFGMTQITELADECRLLPFFLLRKSFGVLPTIN